MVKIYIHKFIDLPLIDYYFCYDDPSDYDISYINDPSEITDVNNCIIVLKDYIIVNGFKDDKCLLSTYACELKENSFETLQYRKQLLEKKKKLLIPVFICKTVLKDIPDYILKYDFYKYYSNTFEYTEVFYVDQLSTNYQVEIKQIMENERLSKHYFIVHDTNYTIAKIVDVKTQCEVAKCDYRVISDYLESIKSGNLDIKDIQSSHIYGIQVYTTSDFNLDILWYCHADVYRNSLFNINIIEDPNNLLFIYNQFQQSAKDDIFIIATKEYYKFVEKDEESDELNIATIKHQELDIAIMYIYIKGFSVYEIGNSFDSLNHINLNQIN